jgi:hypothetical protein
MRPTYVAFPLVSLENSRTWRLRRSISSAVARRTTHTPWRTGGEVRRAAG